MKDFSKKNYTNDLVSIVVPVYNVEKYLDRCVESIVNQTYKNLEIILVDDGSPDNSPLMCDTWAEKDNRIKVIHKENGGLSDARNAGMATATGEYIAFVDSDDWVHMQYIEHMYYAAKNNDTSIVACDIHLAYEYGESDVFLSPDVKIFQTEQALYTLINGNTFRAVAWNKLYHKDVLINETFETGRYHEDEFFTYRIMAKAEKMAFVDLQLYYYFQREGSIMNSVSVRHLDSLDAYVERLQFFEKNYPKLYMIDKAGFCIACVNLYRESDKLPDSEKKRYTNKIRHIRAKVRFRLAEFKNYSVKEWIYILGSGSCLQFFSELLTVRRKKQK